jgi:hypothetical protein
MAPGAKAEAAATAASATSVRIIFSLLTLA